MIRGRRFVEADFDRHPLDDLNPVSCGVFRRQERKGRPGAGPDACDLSFEGVTRIDVGFDLNRLSDPDVGQLGFLVIGLDVDPFEGDNSHQDLTRLNAVDGLARLRFTTSHPKDLSPELIACFGSLERLCEHIHLPVQSGSDRVLKRMGKTSQASLVDFARLFNELTRNAHKEQFLTYYLIAAHPGCALEDMQALKSFMSDKLKITPEQVQVFTPLPSTYSALMYYTELDPFTGRSLFVEKGLSGKEKQKTVLTERSSQARKHRSLAERPIQKPPRRGSDRRRVRTSIRKRK